MLITTSRKPSQKTRTFCKDLERTLGFPYVNRGKMSLREAYIKAKDLGLAWMVIISEMKGNPSRMEFFHGFEEPELTLLISVDDSLSSGNIRKDKLTMQCEIPSLHEILLVILNLPLGDDEEENVMLVRHSNKIPAVIEFYDNYGEKINPQINIKNWILREEKIEGS